MTKSPDAKQFPTITALLERIAVALEGKAEQRNKAATPDFKEPKSGKKGK